METEDTASTREHASGLSPAAEPSATAEYGHVAEQALAQYGLPTEVRPTLVNLSENATYALLDSTDRNRGYLRVHRTRYHDLTAITSELDWIAALEADNAVATAPVIPTVNGERVASMTVNGIARHAVLFAGQPGREPQGADLNDALFEHLGAITARLHLHAEHWQPPATFRRFNWDEDACLGPDARWGSFVNNPWVKAEDRDRLLAAAELVRNELTRYGRGVDRFGLVHADLRPANLLLDKDQTSVIDFDDCGYSWFMYDFAAAVSFNETDARLPGWHDAWIQGYGSVRALHQNDIGMLPTFLMMRRLMLIAWLGSHSQAKEARELGADFATQTAPLATRYLRSDARELY